jgi:positive regulator of sigma E activity
MIEEPYIVAIAMITLVFSMGGYLVWRLYERRTSCPSVSTETILDKLIPKPPEMK